MKKLQHMNIAIFADIHGRILLAFKLCARWELETGEKIDLILQAGDMGIFPDLSRLDKATLRYAKQDATELGFMSNFIAYSDETAAILAQATCNMIFVRGNHEDHRYLDMLEQQARDAIFPVDIYQRLYCLKTGVPYTYTKDQAQISILGIGRIGQHSPQLSPIHIQPYEQTRLRMLAGNPINVVLTHDMPAESSGNRGMLEITNTLKQYRPDYHFYGHIGGQCLQGIADNRVTHFCKLADLEWHGTSQIVHPCSMAILRWQDRTTHSLSVVQEAWYKEYTASSWRYL